MIIAGAVHSLVLSGCITFNPPPAPTTTQPPSTVTTPAPTESPRLKVSAGTTCRELFTPAGSSIISKSVALVGKDSYELSDEGKSRRLAATLEDISTRSEPALRPFIDVTAATLREIESAISSLDEDASINVARFKAAGYELISTCERFID